MATRQMASSSLSLKSAVFTQKIPSPLIIYETLMIESNLIDSAFSTGNRRILLLGSSCIYPRDAGQPMKVPVHLTGTLEPSNLYKLLENESNFHC